MESRIDLLEKAIAIDGEQLQIIYVRLGDLTFWAENPKKHDIDGLIKSMQTHGFRDAPIFDDKLNDGGGGIAGGNGRLEALMHMEATDGYDPPRGILLDKADGAWCVPIQFGINAETEELAEAFAVDHNNLTLGGSGLSQIDVALLWDEDYPIMLERIGAKNIVSVTEEDMKILAEWTKPKSLDDLEDEFGEQEDEAQEIWPAIILNVPHETHQLFWELVGRGTEEEMASKLHEVLASVKNESH